MERGQLFVFTYGLRVLNRYEIIIIFSYVMRFSLVLSDSEVSIHR